MNRTTSKTKESPKLSVRRTTEIEGLLQLLWTLRPELRDHNKLTIILSLNALIQDCRIPATGHSLTTSVDMPVAVSLDDEAAEVVNADESIADISDDVEWD